MAPTSSKIAVTLQPSLKQKLREYGKDNQIKNFSGVILAILDEYFGTPKAESDASSSDVMALIQELTVRVEQLESGSATTSNETVTKPKKKTVAKPKLATRTTSSRSTGDTKSTASKTKPSTKTTRKTVKPTKKTATKTSGTKTKTSRAAKAKSSSSPAKKTKAASSSSWMSTREAFEMYGDGLSWSRFSKLTPQELKDRFNLDSDLSRKVRGSRFNQWLKAGK